MLSPLGQAVASDFIAIYTAESDRHIMTGLRQHSWENDLAEVTLVAAWGTAVGKVMQGGKLVSGGTELYWAKSTVAGSTRSGIGETRTDRRLLSKLISDYEKAHHPELVKALLNSLHYSSTTDAIHSTMNALNNRDFFANPGLAESLDGTEITDALTALIVQVRADAPAMLASPAFQLLAN
jgi:hypothetical protein